MVMAMAKAMVDDDGDGGDDDGDGGDDEDDDRWSMIGGDVDGDD